jgi:hypothetical protein
MLLVNQLEPEELAPIHREQVWLVTDRREWLAAPQFDRRPPAEIVEMQFHELRMTSEVIHTQDDLVVVAS